MQDLFFLLISSLFVYSDAVPEYVLNLDLDPVDRWTQIATEKRNEVIILQFIKLFSHILFQFMRIFIEIRIAI